MKAELTLPERPAAVHLLVVLDVLVLLLVFFALLTSIAQEAGISVRLPESSYRLRSYGRPIVVTARGGMVPAIYVEQERVEFEGLEAALVKRAEESGAETMFVHADEMLPVAVERKIIEIGLALGLNVALPGRQGGGEAGKTGGTVGPARRSSEPETDEKTEP